MLSAAAFGYMVFLKETMVFAFVEWLVAERSWKRALVALGVGLLTFAPFAPAMVGYFTGRSGFYGGGEFRPDSLSIFSWLYSSFGIQPPPATAIVAGLVFTVGSILAAWSMARGRGLLFAVTTTMFGTFLFGTNSFCNWYYLVSGLLLLLIAVGGVGAEEASQKAGGKRSLHSARA